MNTANAEGGGCASPTEEDEGWDVELAREDLDHECRWDPHDGDYQAPEALSAQNRGPATQQSGAQTLVTDTEALAPMVHTIMAISMSL